MAVNRTYAALSGRRVNGYKLQVRDVSEESDEIALRVADGSGLNRSTIDVALVGFQRHLSNPRTIDHILEQILESAKNGMTSIRLDYAALARPNQAA